MRGIPREERLPELSYLHGVAALGIGLDAERERLGGQVAGRELQIAAIERRDRESASPVSPESSALCARSSSELRDEIRACP